MINNNMKIVLFHYHLKPGGVTTVIKHQVAALKNCCDVMILTGEKPDTIWDVPICVIPELAYNHNSFSNNQIHITSEQIRKGINETLGSDCDVLHVHNPILAKNKNLIQILKDLQTKGVNLFLQIHDFAEDGRAAAYSFDDYPSHCHYGVINSRDYQILLKSGLTPDGLHKISNMIKPFSETKKINQALSKFTVYPVRAIRRKNIGEAILLSLFLPKDEKMAITLPPNSSKDICSYSDWKYFCKEHNLPVVLEAGNLYDFTELISSAKRIATTSINEGFGFSFLEPWTANKFLIGRNIPEICVDFTENEINLDHLYNTMNVPLDLFDIENFFNKWKNCIIKNCQLMEHTIDETEIKTSFESITTNKCIDFGLLSEEYQKDILTHLIKTPSLKEKIITLNPVLKIVSSNYNPTAIIKTNKNLVITHYTETTYRNKLITIYKKVVQSDVSQVVDKKTLLRAFFNLNNFSLLKWESYHAEKNR